MGLRPTHGNEKRNRRAFIDSKQVTECFSTVSTTHFIVDPFLPIQVDLKGAKLCRVSVDYEPENTAKQELLGNSLGLGIVAPIVHDK